MATDQASRNTGDQLATAGLAGTPFGARIQNQTRTAGDLQSSQIPVQLVQAILAGAPGLSAQGFGASGSFGGLGSNTLGNLQSLDLQRQMSNSDQFRSFMEAIQKTAMQMSSMGAMCLAPTARIACPGRMTQAGHLRVGDHVLSLDADGQEITAVITYRQTIPILPAHRFAQVGGSYVSPNHPRRNGEPVAMDGTITAERLGLTHTVDFIVDGPTGFYRVGDVWLGSTMDPRHRAAA
jgi:hypothetical protein